MATQTIVKFDDPFFLPDGTPDGRRRVSYEYNDVSLLVTAVSALNTTTTLTLTVRALVNANGRTFQRTIQPGGPNAVEQSQNVPTNAANRLELFVNPSNGRLDGVDWNIG